MTSHRPTSFLVDHHRNIAAACNALRIYACGDNPAALIAAYRTFESEVTSHFEAEEELLAAHGHEYPAINELIREEHAALLRQIMKIGVDVELHSVRLDDIDRLLAALRDHAELETTTLYRWADGHATADAIAQVQGRLIEHTGYSR
jgi:hemerythrin